MVTDNKQRLSAYIDGQIEDDMFEQLQAEPELQQCWRNYHLIGDVMRADTAPVMDFDIAANVAAALEDEPTVLAPKPTKSRFKLSAKVVQLGKQFGQYAIAASVAAVAIVGVQHYGGSSEEMAAAPVLQTRPLVGAPMPASYQVPGMVSANDLSAEQEAKEQQMRANAFLQDHLLQQRLNGVVVQP